MNRPLRIALVAEDYYPQLGGVPEHVHHLAKELSAAGHAPLVVTSHMRGAADDPPFVRRVGTSLVIYANGGVARITVGWRLRNQLARLFRAERCDVVHVHGGLAPVLGLVAPRAAWRAGIPVVATFHTWFPRSAGYALFRRPLQRMLDRHAATIAVSAAARDAMARYFSAPWEIIPNGVDTRVFHPMPRVAGGGPHLLWLGRIEPRNDLGTVLAALPRVLARWPAATLTVVGDGPWRGRAERAARPLGERVRFVGYLNGERPAFYAASDLYLCSTTRASFGVTLLEAMACGTPVVASGIPAFRDVAAGGGALFVPPGDPVAWADAVNRLAADRERREAMGRAGRARAEVYAWPVVAQHVLDVYRRVVR